MPEDDGDFSKPGTADAVRHIRWTRWLVVLVVFLLVAIGVGGWMLRRSMAEQTLAGWCAERDLVCSGRFTRLDASGAVVQDLIVTGKGQRAFQTDEVRVHLAWPGLLSPRVTGVEADAAIVHGVLSDGRISFHGLEKLASSDGKGGGTIPALDIRDGRILIETSAGEASATVSVSGTLPEDGNLSLVLDPASFDTPQGDLKWTGGTAEFTVRDGKVEGRVDIMLEEARTDEVRLANAQLTATVNAGVTDADPATLVWEGRVDEAAGAGFDLSQLETSGQVRFATLTGTSVDAWLAALTEADMQLESGPVSGSGYGAGTARMEASLRGHDGVFSGPVEVSLTDTVLPQGQAGQLEAAGNLNWSSGAGLDFSGRIAGAGVSADDGLTAGLLSRFSLTAPLSAHGESLKASLRKALSDFATEASVTVRASGGKVRIGAQEGASLKAASGLVVEVDPDRTDQSWLSVEEGRAWLGGRFAMQGGEVPKVTANVDSLTWGADGFALSGEDFQLAPWTVNRARFGADVSALVLKSRSDDFSMNAAGTLTLSGPAAGLTLAPSSLSGAIQVMRDENGLRVEPAAQPCLTFETRGVELGGVAFQPNRLNLCSRAGVFMKPGYGEAVGTASLGNVSWPFASKSVAGTLGLERAILDWSAADGFQFSVSSPTLDLPLDIDTRTLTISADRPRVSLATAKGQVPHLSARLEETRLGGTLIPARVSAGQITFDGEIASGGLSGDFTGQSVLIQDFREDPVYQPLLSDLTARMDEWQLALSGPLRLKTSNVPVGDIRANVNLLTLSGTAQVASDRLDFHEGGLQPVMLSERLRGVYTDAAGALEATSDVVITGGKLAGTADVTVRDFGFQTTRLGRVANVNGHVRFADLFTLTTAPSQVLTVGAMNPGIPLSDGEIVFRFSGGGNLAVESAAFPFSGGTLALAPFDWTLGAETQHVEVTAEAIDLEQLVRTLELPKVEAEGTVSGRFPIDVERTKVLIRDARLYADAGGGRLAYLGDAADTAAQSDANVRLAFEALKDFDFTVLEVGLDGNIADRVKITLKLAGKSRNDITYGANANIVRGQPFEFNIAIDSALAELFRSSQFYTNQQKVTDFVVEKVLTDRGLQVVEDE